MQFSQLSLVAIMATLGLAAVIDTDAAAIVDRGTEAVQACQSGSYRCDSCNWQDTSDGDQAWLCATIQVCNTSGNWVTTHNCRSLNEYWWCRQTGDNFRCG